MDVIADCMIRPLREQVGLGSPPAPYYTNNRVKNNILKQHLQRKAAQLPEFVESMKALLITEQHSEIEKAVATYGEYRVVSCHSNLACECQSGLRYLKNKNRTR